MLFQRLQPPLRAAINSIPRSPSSNNNAQRYLEEAFAQLTLSPSRPGVGKIFVRYAHHKSQGAVNGAKNGRGKHLGAKKSGEQYVVPGNIIFRQRGTHWFPGENCGMGRDHTIYAKEEGYVKYYKDPEKNPKRQYIGVTFERDQILPLPPNSARRRRLGMLPVKMNTISETENQDDSDIPPPPGHDLMVETESGSAASPIRNVLQVELKARKGEKEKRVLRLKDGYMFRESNWEIGRAAERANVKVKLFKPRDRWTAWRKANERKAKNEDSRTLGRLASKKGKKK